jgi:hypothetical protein
MVPAVGLVASPVCSCVAALVAARLPATALVPSIKLVGVINVLQIKADQQSILRSDASAAVDRCTCQSCAGSCLCSPLQ